MSLLVVSRPVWQPRDQAWLKQLRDRHGGATFDPALGPHLTLVFPADEVAEDAAVSHIHAVASGFAPFDAAFRAILPVKDSFSDDTYLYLVPDLGTASIIRLHDRLYTGSLAEALRLDLPYWPHITLGRFSSARIHISRPRPHPRRAAPPAGWPIWG